jgi:phosphoglycolate phosphatase-like HAD superfamily hydrolase
VIGVARKGNAEELKHHGAQLVVDDLAELVD